MAVHLAALQEVTRSRPTTATTLSSSQSPQWAKPFPNPPPPPKEPLRSPYSSYSPQSPRRSLTSPRSVKGPVQLPKTVPLERVHTLKPGGAPSRSRFSDFSISSEETRIRALYNRITAAQSNSYKSVFVDIEEKESPRPHGIRLIWWLLELFAWLFSLTTLCFLVLVLHQYNGKKQSDWPSQTFTLNALVALIATLTRASLLVPIAQAISQAKWDWFSNRRGREVQGGKPLADLEAFDNASRGVCGSLGLLWRLRGWHFSAIGAVLMTLSFGFDTFTQQVLSVVDLHADVQQFFGSVPRALTYQDVTSSAETTGLNGSAKAAVNNGVLSENVTSAQVFCPSGDCLWPNTPTIGVCGICMDISKEIKPPSLGVSDQGLPVMLNINNGSGIIPNTTGVAGSSIGMLIADFDIISNQSDTAATECALWFCLQAMSVSQVAGVQTTTVINTWNEASPLSNSSSLYTFTSIPPSFNISSSSNYTVDDATLEAYSSYLPTIITGSVSGSDQNYTSTSDAAEAIWLSLPTLDAWIQRLATSMTNRVRLAGFSALLASDNEAEIQQYAGTAYEMTSFIHVRWGWFAFPVSMVVFSLFYLVASMWHASNAGVHVWKSSPLPLLLADVDPSVKMQAERAMGEPGGVVKVVGKRRVSLIDEDGRWVFRSVDGGTRMR